MKIVIQEDGGRKIKLHIPLWKSFAGIVARILCSDKAKNIDYGVDEGDVPLIQTNVNQENTPSRKEVKKFFADAIEILKNHKGLELVEAIDSDGDYVKITL